MTHVERGQRLFAGIVMVASLVCLAMGCNHIPMEVIEEVSHPPKDFVLGPEDVLEVNVWRNPELSRETVIRPDGMISMPLIGDVMARGLTAEQLAARVAERLKRYKDAPMVSVSVQAVNSYYIYVLGEVQNPGKFQLKSYATVLQAIAMSGGFTQFASRNSLTVIRNSQNGHERPQEMRIPVSYDDLLSGSGKIGNFILKPGDTVVVP